MTESYEWGSPSQRPANGLFRSRSHSNFLSLPYQYPSQLGNLPNGFTFPAVSTITTSTTSTFNKPIFAEPFAAISLPRAERETAAIGFRAWNIVGGFLSAVCQTALWPSDQPTVALCACDRDHEAPFVTCGCGLHAWTSLAQAKEYIPMTENLHNMVVGACIGWGRVFQHDDEGWRAQYARPIAFLDTGLFQEHPHLKALAKRYSVPILPTRASLEMYAAEYGEALHAPI